jgi:hypothetical protein
MTAGMEQYFGANNELPSGPPLNTNACECMRQHINDIIEFLTDVHTLSRIKASEFLILIQKIAYSKTHFFSNRKCLLEYNVKSPANPGDY